MRVYHNIFKFSHSFNSFRPYPTIDVFVYYLMPHYHAQLVINGIKYLLYYSIFLWKYWWCKSRIYSTKLFCSFILKVLVFVFIITVYYIHFVSPWFLVINLGKVDIFHSFVSWIHKTHHFFLVSDTHSRIQSYLGFYLDTMSR